MKTIVISELLSTIGHNFHSIRNARKETLQGVASAIGSFHTVISKIENGRYPTLQLGMIVKLCNHYEVQLQQVMALEQSQIFQLTQHNSDGSQRLVGQELALGYELCVEQYKERIGQYKEQIEFLRKMLNEK
jgi:transcriptional regulator with XRE-family HTH domain